MPSLTPNLKPLLLPATQITPIKPRQQLPPTSTRFGGTPYFESPDSWPICGGCNHPLTFILQWNLADCPHSQSTCLFTFFYCHECGSWGDIPADLKNACAVRRYPNPSDAKAKLLEDDSPEQSRTKECAVKLELIQSLPDWEGLSDIAPDLAQLSAAADENEPWAAYQTAVEELLGAEPDFHTQIGGYPHWVQGADIPECKACSKSMRLLAQIDSEEDAGLMWGDSGSVYLFECSAHPDQIAMRLQCF
jgi:uncharacterized protein YwqG